MSTQNQNDTQEKYDIFTPKEARRTIEDVFNSTNDEPAGLIKMLVMLRDHLGLGTGRLDTALTFLIDAAFNGSLAQGKAVEGYIEALRQGRDPDTDESTSDENPSTTGEDAMIKHFSDLFERYKHERHVLIEIASILEVAQVERTEEGFGRQMLAEAFALILESPHTPEQVRDRVSDALVDLANRTGAADILAPDNVREWVPIALIGSPQQQGAAATVGKEGGES